MRPEKRAVPTVLSVFSGAGGLDLGLEAAGFRVVGCVERDIAARNTLIANRDNWPLVASSVEEAADAARAGRLPIDRVDVIAAGPPCQPFSKAAQWSPSAKTGINDPRAACLTALLDLVEVLTPRILVIENVVGFARGKAAAAPQVESRLLDINRLKGTSYRLSSQVFNAVDYGVPQRRERSILVAASDGREIVWPTPTHLGEPVRAWDALVDVHSTAPPEAAGKWANLIRSIPEGHNYLWHTDRGGGLPLFGYRTRFWSFLLKLAKREPAWTLPAQPGPATGPFHWDNRPLSIEEMLRLQSFPADWQVDGTYRDQVRQVGNATPPLLAEHLGRAIGREAFGMKYRRPLQFSISRQGAVPKPHRRGSVPVDLARLAGPKAAHGGTGRGPRPIHRETSG